ncbi:DUF2326 domain-containing protein [Cohnella luojiensis]|uniref:DUF2326 domain-containing protein n=1 Tax=Cohnella luojiensis TaxID=652876 RepID=A0A4Y8LW02_9BACL|nr:DUF2326 domain-containing protein [Cohnella luojiensis]TFE23992.1 DUF2326 domain-containing protein [Cohnella luojiensis]
MKIVQIYSNKKEFKDVHFNEHLNIILGEVKDKKNTETDSHNLGKSTLISLIDFCLLKGKSDNLFLFKNYELFIDFIFFIELKKDDNNFVTIRRAVENNTKICIKFHERPNQNYKENLYWDYENLALNATEKSENPRHIVTEFFSLEFHEKYDLRKLLGYFLRTQYDYDEVFKLRKYSGKLIDWKPALLDLIGFKGNLLGNKLALFNQIEVTKEYLKKMKLELSVTDFESDVINSLIDAKITDKQKIEEQINSFDFYKTEREINRSLVEEIESEISRLNSIEYRLTFEITKIKDALSRKLMFDLDKIEKILSEVNIYFPNQVKKKYEQLVEFNQVITQERNKYQESTLLKKNDELEKVRENLKKYNEQRMEKLSALQEEDSFTKYKKYQQQIIEIDVEINQLLNKLEHIDIIKTINKNLDKLKKDYEAATEKLLVHLEEPNQTYIKIKNFFRELVQYILNESSIIYFNVNKEKNPDFHAEFVNVDETKITSQSDGYSYKKMLCVCFDLAVLMTYSKSNFYHFVYHDGTFESMSDMRKIKYLQAVRHVSKKYDIQYIFTALTDDIPRDSNNQTIQFEETEIALVLDDRPDDLGRLFSKRF